jgi:predicted Ser/Thr protein kinase
VSGPLPKRLGRYEIQEEIGRGMMGVVYRGLDPALGRVVALKTVQLAWAISEEDRRNFEKRFMAEARVSAGLSHPGIIVVHDIGQDSQAKTVFIAMEFLQGRTLADIATSSPMSWQESLRITARVAEALHHAHAAGVVHRDVKPANIMVLPSGDPKIMDFGIAKVPASQLTTVGEFFGTPSYMSPEQASGASVDGRSDLFSLGSVLYLLLTGRRAFDAASVPAILARVTSQDPPPPSRVLPGLPEDIDYVVSRVLAKDPKDRYADGNTLAEDLVDVREGRSPRHRGGWTQPTRVDGTLAPAEAGLEPETADLRRRIGTPIAHAPHSMKRLWHGRRAYVAVAVVAAALATALLYARGARPPIPAPDPAGLGEPAAGATPEARSSLRFPFRIPLLPASEPPGSLEVSLVHALRTGTLRVWIDDELVLEKPLESYVTKRVLIIKSRKGRLKETLEVRPGEHVIRVRVEGEDFGQSRRFERTFKSGETEHLMLDVGGLLSKDLSAEWLP